jgi:hypothetical protein
MHVGFVDGLKARPACKGAEGKKEWEAQSPHEPYDESVSTL